MKKTAGRILRIALYMLAAVVAAPVVGLLFLTLVDPPTTMVQTQRRIESWFSDSDDAYDKRYRFVPIDSIDTDLHWAVVASEDGRFFEHAGVDWQAVEKALDEHERGRRLRGASTITQQLVKNLFLTTHSTYIRKAAELPLAYTADFILTKRRILELYLNVVEWGPGVYGAEAASRYHYGKSAMRMTREEAARLAACLPAPRTRRPQRMHSMSASILSRMSQLGH